MKLLIDTNILLWMTVTPEKLPRAARELLNDTGNELVFSSVNIWEITIKAGLRRPDFVVEPRRLLRHLLTQGFSELPVTGAHALAVGELPNHHGDPFDRLLVAQATVEEAILLTADAMLARYPGPIRKV